MSQPQHMHALDIANERRIERSRIHRRVRETHDARASCIEIAKLLADQPPVCLHGMRVEELLQWIVGWGGMKGALISEALSAAGCSEFKYVRDLSARQRVLIVDVLTSYAYGREAA